MRALRLIYVCQQNPWKLNGGALIRNYWLVRALAERYPVDLVTADDDFESVPPDFARACASITRFPRPRGNASRLARLGGMLRPGGSYFTSGSVSRPLRRLVRELARGGGCAAMTDLQMEAALPRHLPFIYNAHNAERGLLQRRAALERAPAARAFVTLEAWRIAPIERRFLRAALFTAACSEDDRQELAELAPETRERILIVPNGVDLERYSSVAAEPGEAGTVLVTGSFDWRPNRVALDWFCNEVLPALRKRAPAGAYRIRVAGRMDPQLAAWLDALPNVTAVANPPDMRVELARAAIVAAPILASSGTRLRILEAWAAGRPVITTTAGAFGLDYQPDRELVRADGAPAFADALSRLLDDGPVRARLRVAALAASQGYAWPRIAQTFLAQAEPFLRGIRAA